MDWLERLFIAGGVILVGGMMWLTILVTNQTKSWAILQDRDGIFVPNGMTAQAQIYDPNKKIWVAVSPKFFNVKYRVEFQAETAIEELKK